MLIVLIIIIIVLFIATRPRTKGDSPKPTTSFGEKLSNAWYGREIKVEKRDKQERDNAPQKFFDNKTPENMKKIECTSYMVILFIISTIGHRLFITLAFIGLWLTVDLSTWNLIGLAISCVITSIQPNKGAGFILMVMCGIYLLFDLFKYTLCFILIAPIPIVPLFLGADVAKFVYKTAIKLDEKYNQN